MTCNRRDGGRDETSFGQWIRVREDLDSTRYDLTVNDVDWIFHRYSVGRWQRRVQMMVNVEVKAFNKMPDKNQRQTLYFQHQLLKGAQWLNDNLSPGERRRVRHFGYFLLSLHGKKPERDTPMRWGHFDKRGSIITRGIDIEQLVKLLRIEIHPETLEPLDFLGGRMKPPKPVIIGQSKIIHWGWVRRSFPEYSARVSPGGETLCGLGGPVSGPVTRTQKEVNCPVCRRREME